MKLILAIISMALLTTDSLALKNPFSRSHSKSAVTAPAQPPSGHIYKGAKVSDDLFDSKMDCGLDLGKLEECIKKERGGSSGKGESFCNDVKLFAGNKEKLADPKMPMPFIEGLKDLQDKYARQFLDAGLHIDQIAAIPSISNFQCKKINTK